jgi:hypothetical protein
MFTYLNHLKLDLDMPKSLIESKASYLYLGLVAFKAFHLKGSSLFKMVTGATVINLYSAQKERWVLKGKE